MTWLTQTHERFMMFDLHFEVETGLFFFHELRTLSYVIIFYGMIGEKICRPSLGHIQNLHS